MNKNGKKALTEEERLTIREGVINDTKREIAGIAHFLKGSLERTMHQITKKIETLDNLLQKLDQL